MKKALLVLLAVFASTSVFAFDRYDVYTVNQGLDQSMSKEIVSIYFTSSNNLLMLICGEASWSLTVESAKTLNLTQENCLTLKELLDNSAKAPVSITVSDKQIISVSVAK